MSTVDADWSRLKRVSLIGTYMPRMCGIGTFSADLSDALAKAAPNTDFGVVAMNDRPEGYEYPPRVKFEIQDKRRSDYHLAADFLNMGKADVVSVQHEFGIFGGPEGRMVIDFLRRLREPVVTTLHTVLKDPTDGQRTAMSELTRLSDRLVVLSELGVEFLRDIYKVPAEKIAFIPHGIHDVPFVDPAYYKDQFGVEGKKVLLTFGLLSPNKGIENMIDALPKILERVPDAVYVVLGATHPGVVAHSGESYRQGLIDRARKNGVEDKVQFVDKFVEVDELMEYLGCADVYITPYLNEAQIVSGTLAYAMGAGKATVSTPYWYAQEMLADGRGTLVPFGDVDAMADGIARLFEKEVDRHAMRKRAYQFTRQMRWSEVAKDYLNVFATVLEERAHNPRAIQSRMQRRDPSIDLAEINLEHLNGLTDDCGIMQHAKFNIGLREEGYCTCDNGRALIVAVQAVDHSVGADVDTTWLAGRYLAFLEHAFNEKIGRFRNFMSYDRRWLEDECGSEDSHGRALWGLGVAVARSRNRGHALLAADLFRRALPATLSFKYAHTWAYCIIGLHAYLRRYSGDSEAKRTRDELASRLFDVWQKNASDDWPWPLQEVTYANGRLVQALLLSGRWTFTDPMVEQALRSLDWLIKIQTSPEGHFAPVGCNGWMPRGGKPARFDQQSVEPAAMVSACIEAYQITQQAQWLDRAQWCFNWYLGDNDLCQPVYDEKTGGCCDGLTPDGVNENQGAEATLSFLMSLLTLYDHSLGLSSDTDEDTAQPKIVSASTSASAVKPAKDVVAQDPEPVAK